MILTLAHPDGLSDRGGQNVVHTSAFAWTWHLALIGYLLTQEHNSIMYYQWTLSLVE